MIFGSISCRLQFDSIYRTRLLCHSVYTSHGRIQGLRHNKGLLRFSLNPIARTLKRVCRQCNALRLVLCMQSMPVNGYALLPQLPDGFQPIGIFLFAAVESAGNTRQRKRSGIVK